jgi:hypothetical protein
MRVTGFFSQINRHGDMCRYDTTLTGICTYSALSLGCRCKYVSHFGSANAGSASLISYMRTCISSPL